MKITIYLLIFSILFISTGFSQEINPSESKVFFEVGNMKIRSAEGYFAGMSGMVNFDKADLENSVFNVCVDATTINTDNEQRDEHLKTADFFNVEKFPTICFRSSSIVSVGSGLFIANGELTMHGVTKSVIIPFSYENNTFTGDFIVNRLEYGVGSDTGTFMVSDEVEMKIICVVKN